MISHGAKTPPSIIARMLASFCAGVATHHHRQADRLAGLRDTLLHRPKREVAAVALLGIIVNPAAA